MVSFSISPSCSREYFTKFTDIHPSCSPYSPHIQKKLHLHTHQDRAVKPTQINIRMLLITKDMRQIKGLRSEFSAHNVKNMTERFCIICPHTKIIREKLKEFRFLLSDLPRKQNRKEGFSEFPPHTKPMD